MLATKLPSNCLKFNWKAASACLRLFLPTDTAFRAAKCWLDLIILETRYKDDYDTAILKTQK